VSILDDKDNKAQAGDNQNKLYVGNLSYNTTVDILKDAFSKFGDVVDAVIITDKMSGRSKGFGFVEFAKADDAKKAVEGMNGKEIDGRAAVVNVARPQRPR